MTTEDFLKQGITALNEGQKAEARSLLMQVVEQDERNEAAWLWLSGAVDTDEDRRICLENVLAINPSNKAAQKGLSILRQRAASIKPLPEGVERLALLKAVETAAPQKTAAKPATESQQFTSVIFTQPQGTRTGSNQTFCSTVVAGCS